MLEEEVAKPKIIDEDSDNSLLPFDDLESFMKETQLDTNLANNVFDIFDSGTLELEGESY